MSEAYNKPLPDLDDPFARPFWEHARAGELTIQRCEACGHRHFPPTPLCPACLSDRQSQEVVSGNGTLLAWVRFHQVYWEGFRDEVPYDTCLVQLDEGPVMISNLVGKIPEDLHAGAKVTVVFEPVTGKVTLPRFKLV
jgi:uncharacterized OB-fold protein